MDTNVPVEDQATAGLDYLPTSSNVMMADNATSTNVLITILHVSNSKQNNHPLYPYCANLYTTCDYGRYFSTCTLATVSYNLLNPALK